MDPRSGSKSSEFVLEAVIVADTKGETSASVSKHVLPKEKGEEDVNKPEEGKKESDSRMAKDDGVRCSSSISTHEEVADNEAESDASASAAKAKAKKEYHAVDLSGGEESDGQRICRICHFGSDQTTPDRVSGKPVRTDLVEIGCACKNELGLAHFHCAEAWFKLRGNSVCEICGCTAKNVTVRLTEEWSEERGNTLEERRRRGRGQSCCIFMVFLLTVLLLHWFFKKMTGYYHDTT